MPTYVFSLPGGGSVNVEHTTDGSDLPAPVAGYFNIAVLTVTPGSLPAGYQGSAFAPGAVVYGTSEIIGASSLQLLAGNGFAVVDTTNGDSITAGSGNQTIVGGGGDTITGGSGPVFIDGSAGDMSIVVGSAGGSDTILSGSADTITGGSDNATIYGPAGDTINLTGGSGTALIEATAGDEKVTLGSGASTVYGAAGDTITGGSGFDGSFDVVCTAKYPLQLVADGTRAA